MQIESCTRLISFEETRRVLSFISFLAKKTLARVGD